MYKSSTKPALGIIGSSTFLIISLFLFQDGYAQDSGPRMTLALLLSLFFLGLLLHNFMVKRGEE
ncbi:MAG TPA: hypothetical protein VK590_09645 [Saprospiraceae bacterium]|nr:hypothetical protein [Saprospiraceae bacterium]